MLLVLITGQLAITGQLGRKVHLQSIGLLFGSRDKGDLEKELLVDKAAKDEFALFWETIAGLEVKAFSCFQE